jgi:choline monooxygenase
VKNAPQTLPAAWYADPAHWPRERAAIFRRSWQFLTHESALSAPGAWAAATIADFPVFAVRDEHEVLRGFHNVCRHRAGPLVHGDAGICDGALTCKYHGWRYALDGRLRAARDFGAAADFDPRAYGLIPLRLECWRGLVFVAMGEAPPLADLLAPIDERLGAQDWSDLRISLRRTHMLACNWKTYVENYLEGYHVPDVHPGLDADILSDQYKVVVEGRVALHFAPPRKPDPVYEGLWAWVWPNIGVNIYRRGLMIERMTPVGHTHTRLDYLYLTPGGEAIADDTLALSDEVTAEDKWITERVQENLNAGIYDVGRLSPKHEAAVAAFQAWVRASTGE